MPSGMLKIFSITFCTCSRNPKQCSAAESAELSSQLVQRPLLRQALTPLHCNLHTATADGLLQERLNCSTESRRLGQPLLLWCRQGGRSRLQQTCATEPSLTCFSRSSMMALVTPLPFFLTFCRPWMPSVSINCLAFLQHDHTPCGRRLLRR